MENLNIKEKTNHYNKELQDIRDFIARSRNTLATQKMSIHILLEEFRNLKQNNNIKDIVIDNIDTDFDPDFIKPTKMSIEERIEKIEKFNIEMFEWIDLIDKFDKKSKSNLKEE